MHNLLPHLSRMSPPGQLWPVLSQSRTSCIGESQASNNDKARGFAGVLLHLWKPDCTDLFPRLIHAHGSSAGLLSYPALGGPGDCLGPPAAAPVWTIVLLLIDVCITGRQLGCRF